MSWLDLDPEFRTLLETHCTPKQLLVFKLQASGMSIRQIARYLGISRSAVRARIDTARHNIARQRKDAA